jgi:hypothetical protein
MPTWEWITSNWELMITLFSIAGFYFVTKSDMKILKENVVDIKAAIKQQTDILRDLAVQKERLDNQGAIIGSMQIAQRQSEQRIYELSHGQGFILKEPQ